LSQRLFIACGAAMVCAGIGIATLWAQEAQEFWRQEALRARPPMTSVPQTGAGVTSDWRAGTNAASGRQRPKITIRPKRENRLAGPDERRLQSSGNRYCVRTCDGYYFPLSSRGTNAQDTDACKAACPGARMEVYERASDDRIEDAISLKGKPYSSLPTALSYRTELTQACSCKVERKRGFAAFFEDATLVKGDIVVTEKGIYVFAGASRFPYRESDFVPLSKARGLPRKIATYLAEIDRLMQ
jgi:hypothetical protein